jgi:hypothetical protein
VRNKDKAKSLRWPINQPAFVGGSLADRGIRGASNGLRAKYSDRPRTIIHSTYSFCSVCCTGRTRCTGRTHSKQAPGAESLKSSGEGAQCPTKPNSKQAPGVADAVRDGLLLAVPLNPTRNRHQEEKYNVTVRYSPPPCCNVCSTGRTLSDTQVRN